MGDTDIPPVITALVTPFRKGALDPESVRGLMARQTSVGVSGVLIAAHGAGEAATFRPGEFETLIDVCVRAAAGETTVIAEVSSNSTAKMLHNLELAEARGAKVVLIAQPWYNKPSQDGLLRHFEAAAERSFLPIIIANRSDLACVDLDETTAGRIARLPNVAGFADWSSDVRRISKLRRLCPPSVKILSGDDGSALGALAHGSDAIISLYSNFAPRTVVEMATLALLGDWGCARGLQDQLTHLHQAARPAPVAAIKHLLASRGHCLSEVRLPLVPFEVEASTEMLRRAAAALHGLS